MKAPKMVRSVVLGIAAVAAMSFLLFTWIASPVQGQGCCGNHGSTPASPERADASKAASVRIEVDQAGFHPNQVRVKTGRPLRLVFHRSSDATCATAVRIPSLGIADTALPLNRDTTVTVQPRKDGTYAFTCPMNMVKGTLVANP